jgi:hypothetical protein
MGAVEAAHAELVMAVRSGGLVDQNEAPETIAAAILIAGIERLMPGMLGRIKLTGWSSEEVTTAAERMQSGPLRSRAEQVRVGEAVAPVSLQVEAKPRPEVAIPEAVVVLRSAITYRAADSSTVLIREGGCSIPAPVAAAAVEQGIGFAPGTPAAHAALNEIELGKGGRAVDVGVDLAGWVEAERARQRAA